MRIFHELFVCKVMAQFFFKPNVEKAAVGLPVEFCKFQAHASGVSSPWHKVVAVVNCLKIRFLPAQL